MDISVVIPAKNEAENVEPLINEIRAALDGRVDYELIYVDDGSTDDTAARLLAIREQGYGRLRILRHPQSCGQSTAIHTGVAAARAPWIVTLDADGQNDPADVPKLLEALRAEPRDARLQLVSGYRRRRNDNWLKRISSRIANAVRGWLLKDGTPDTGCGLKLFSRDAFLTLPYFDHMHRFLPALFQRHGSRIRIVEVNHRPRTRGVSKYGVHNRLWVGLVDLVGVMWLQSRTRFPEEHIEL
jgi:dolichol-phosphate mannosyltransferase